MATAPPVHLRLQSDAKVLTISVLTKEIRKKIAKYGIMVENFDQFNRRYHTGWVLLWESGCIIVGWIRRIVGRNRVSPGEKRPKKKGWGYY